MNLDGLLASASAQQAIVLTGEDEVLVIDKCARDSVITPREEELCEEAKQRIAELLSESGEPTSRQLHARIHIPAEIINDDALVPVLSKVISDLAELYGITVHWTFGQTGKDLEPLHQTICRAFEAHPFIRDKTSIFGPFRDVTDHVRDTWMGCGMRLGQVLGWSQGCKVEEPIEAGFPCMRELARFGFRIPAVFYVHRDNVSSMLDMIDSALQANYHSGFLLPLLSMSPYYTGNSDRALPSDEQYTTLLYEAYERFPYFDRSLFPLNGLTSAVANGAWDTTNDIPSKINVLIRQGSIDVFKQAPRFSTFVVSWDDTLKAPPGDITDAIRSVLKATYPVAFCSPCQWRRICGGLDAVGPVAPEGYNETNCGYRMTFLEAFAWNVGRARDSLKSAKENPRSENAST